MIPIIKLKKIVLTEKFKKKFNLTNEEFLEIKDMTKSCKLEDPIMTEQEFYDNLERDKYIEQLKLSRKQHYSLYNLVEIFWEDLVYQMSWEDVRGKIRASRDGDLTLAQVEDAKMKPIEEILDSYDIRHWKRSCICPFCWKSNVTKFSFKDNLFKCFGGCSKWWDSIKFIAYFLDKDCKKDFKEIVQLLNRIT